MNPEESKIIAAPVFFKDEPRRGKIIAAPVFFKDEPRRGKIIAGLVFFKGESRKGKIIAAPVFFKDEPRRGKIIAGLVFFKGESRKGRTRTCLSFRKYMWVLTVGRGFSRFKQLQEYYKTTEKPSYIKDNWKSLRTTPTIRTALFFQVSCAERRISA